MAKHTPIFELRHVKSSNRKFILYIMSSFLFEKGLGEEEKMGLASTEAGCLTRKGHGGEGFQKKRLEGGFNKR